MTIGQEEPVLKGPAKASQEKEVIGRLGWDQDGIGPTSRRPKDSVDSVDSRCWQALASRLATACCDRQRPPAMASDRQRRQGEWGVWFCLSARSGRPEETGDPKKVPQPAADGGRASIQIRSDDACGLI